MHLLSSQVLKFFGVFYWPHLVLIKTVHLLTKIFVRICVACIWFSTTIIAWENHVWTEASTEIRVAVLLSRKIAMSRQWFGCIGANSAPSIIYFTRSKYNLEIVVLLTSGHSVVHVYICQVMWRLHLSEIHHRDTLVTWPSSEAYILFTCLIIEAIAQNGNANFFL